MSVVRSARLAVLAVAVLTLTLSGCGRRGPLEPPSAAQKPEVASAAAVAPGAAQDEKPAPSENMTSRSFSIP
ncbi:lipoprotein [Breoghania sp.]|uniref:LPS translocon maturation chaperone LptM n=1 Tax=Breoghania sp. TaxID=2065378 RepID=UPI002633EF27|nr:lipoprotein [Breoghania sp.]MDJ0930622.1 lipoprotein [Breoghania sp.]